MVILIIHLMMRRRLNTFFLVTEPLIALSLLGLDGQPAAVATTPAAAAAATAAAATADTPATTESTTTTTTTTTAPATTTSAPATTTTTTATTTTTTATTTARTTAKTTTAAAAAASTETPTTVHSFQDPVAERVAGAATLAAAAPAATAASSLELVDLVSEREGNSSELLLLRHNTTKEVPQVAQLVSSNDCKSVFIQGGRRRRKKVTQFFVTATLPEPARYTGDEDEEKEQDHIINSDGERSQMHLML
jgi:hypothetical protein